MIITSFNDGILGKSHTGGECAGIREKGLQCHLGKGITDQPPLPCSGASCSLPDCQVDLSPRLHQINNVHYPKPFDLQSIGNKHQTAQKVSEDVECSLGENTNQSCKPALGSMAGRTAKSSVRNRV